MRESYASALRKYFETGSESVLDQAYEIGRRAVTQGLGVLDMITLHNETLEAALAGAGSAAEIRRIVERAARFFTESLSPFEMTHRGYQEANTELRRLAATLERRVAERTAEAEQSRDAAEAFARRTGFLAEASSILASSLDFHETLRSLARLATPTIADWCVIHIVEDGQIREVAISHADPAKQSLIREFRRYDSPDWNSPNPASRALRSGASQLDSDVTDAEIASWARDPELRRLLEALGTRSSISAPLVARGHTLGAISFMSAHRRYGPDDVMLAEEIARRAAVAVDNARLYEEALASSKAKSDFLAVVSHEIRTPLNAITGYTDLLETGVAGSLTDEQKALLDRIKVNVWHQLRIIEEILTFSRMEAGRDEVRIESVDLAALVQEIIALAGPHAEEKGLRFQVHAPSEPTPVMTDPRKLRHILLNLLTNAVKFTDHGEVELTAALEDGGMVFRVRDTGIGIAPENQEKIFEPFVQTEDVLTREKGGTGLGLSVARRIARTMGGDVTVSSELGKGSTFTVRLPSGPGPRRDGR